MSNAARHVLKNKCRPYLVCGLVVGVMALAVIVLLASPRTYATNNKVTATLCDNVSQPAVTITDPSSLSTATNVPNLTVSGTTERTSQIDVLVNNVYASSVALEDDGSFTTTIGLQQGDNTITLHAYFSCNNTSADTIIIATYNPAVTPPVDNNPGTVVDQGTGNGGVVSNGGPGIYSQPSLTPGSTQTPPKSKPGPVDRIKNNLGIGEQKTGYRADLSEFQVVGLRVLSWLVLVMVIVGILIMVIPARCLALLSRHRDEATNTKKARTWLRFIGLLLVLVGLGILQL